MLCNSCVRFVFVQAAHIDAYIEQRQLVKLGKSLNATRGLSYSWNSLYTARRRMMVDTGATAKGGPIVDPSQEKDDSGGYASGGWKSEDGKLSCGYSSFRGKRATMEDFYDIKTSQVDGKTVCLFGIFDGHGGSRAAEYLKGHLFQNLMKHPLFSTNTKLAISETYQQTDKDFLIPEKILSG
ncbi:hypothetical protein HAX54_025752 [Datura stramonium]|uniref:protein-serine/threonine phosphatase n=1 Tax=Datura stramonium TaxID=4076 RepID=A0ABS8V242_DATST|nr:hypothetical protein [Datura stramonium]